jgi:glycosyltransferase involved in cell wall biosynthesis
MPNPKVSIVVATYGRFEHFRKLVDSVRTAFPKDTYEIIAVASDSPDTVKIDWISKQWDILLRSVGVRRAGQPRSMSLYTFENIGIRSAQHEWVFVTNDDTEFDSYFYDFFWPMADSWDVIMVNGHLGEVGLGCRTAVIGDITPPGGAVRPLYLYDFAIIRKSVYERIGGLDENLDWFGKGFDLAMACETTPGLRICYASDLKIDHAITAEGRTPPHYAKDFQFATNKWNTFCNATGWKYTWPW